MTVTRSHSYDIEARRRALMSQLFLTVDELAELMPLGRRTIITLIKAGEIPARKFGLKWMISTNWLRGQVAKPEEDTEKRRD